MKPAPEHNRLTKRQDPMLGNDASYGNNGFFIFPHYKVVDYEIRCMISDATWLPEEFKGHEWEHVSVTVARKRSDPTRCPTWAEMCFVKDIFWNKEDTVIQFHPPESEYVNAHPFCLHLWKPVFTDIPLPPSIYVGPNNQP